MAWKAGSRDSSRLAAVRPAIPTCSGSRVSGDTELSVPSFSAKSGQSWVNTLPQHLQSLLKRRLPSEALPDYAAQNGTLATPPLLSREPADGHLCDLCVASVSRGQL